MGAVSKRKAAVINFTVLSGSVMFSSCMPGSDRACIY